VLKRGILIGVLQEKPRAVRPFIADEPPSRPSVLREDDSHPFEIRLEDRISPRNRGIDRLLRLNSLTQLLLDRLIGRDAGSDLTP
jgi:hypothetical protein